MTFIHKTIYLSFVFFLLVFFAPAIASATSGACSGHGGVDCSAGRDWDGSVICNDGWTNSSVSYSSMVMCADYSFVRSCPQHASYNELLSSCVCDDDYYVSQTSSNVCVTGLAHCVEIRGIGATYSETLNACGCSANYVYHDGVCVVGTQFCAELMGVNSRYNTQTQACICDVGYVLQGGVCISVLDVKDSVSPVITPAPIISVVPVVPPVISTPVPQVAGIKISSPDPVLIARMKGRILLQTESHGEAWYVHPTTGKRHYMKDGSVAYQMMRNFGLGIKNADLAKIPTSNDTFQLPSSMKALKGKILLQVEARGEAWYVHPDTGKRYYMKDGNEAYQLMRLYSLGISNDNLGKIPSGE